MTRPIAVMDLAWLVTDSAEHPMHVAGLFVCRLPDDAKPGFVRDLVAEMRATRVAVDPFDRRVRVRGRLWPQWQPVDAIDTDDRVRHVALAAPGDDRQLETLVAELHRERLDLARPLWQFHLIEGLAGNRFALYAKFHHSLVDGVGAVRVMQSVFSTDPAERDAPPIWARPRPRREVQPRRRGRPRAVVAGVAAAVGNVRDRSGVRPYSAPRSILNSAITSQRHVSVRTVEIARLRSIADAIDGTVNDAYLALCATALRRYLGELGALPDRPLTAAVPVSVRAVDGDELGNAITFGFTSLATDVADVRDRTRTIVASMTRAKAALAEVGVAASTAYTVATMGPFIVTQVLGVAARLSPMFNVAISNLPGPQEPLFYNGCAVESIHPVSVLQSGQALNITALSYRENLQLTITACPENLPHIERLADYCLDALVELEKL